MPEPDWTTHIRDFFSEWEATWVFLAAVPLVVGGILRVISRFRRESTVSVVAFERVEGLIDKNVEKNNDVFWLRALFYPFLIHETFEEYCSEIDAPNTGGITQHRLGSGPINFHFTFFADDFSIGFWRRSHERSFLADAGATETY